MPYPPSELPPGWYNPADRVPRRDQMVRVLTRHGVDHRAQFLVTHTDSWPSGAAWLVSNGREALTFAEVVSWSPDPNTPPPKRSPQGKAEPPGQRPAILNEVLIEVERTGTLLRLLPSGQLDWSPHPDIPTLRLLSYRLVRIVARIGWILDLDRVEVLFEPDLPELQSPEEVIATYAANESDVQKYAVSLTAQDLRAPWLLERNGASLAHLPRGDALRTFGLTPLVYHRGELALLLTALGIRVPRPYPLWPIGDTSAETSPLPTSDV